MGYERVYVCSLQTPNHFYVGTTLRVPWYRNQEHAAGHGSKFTAKHGFKKMLIMELVPTGTSGTLEDELTIELMCRYGWGAVRGGDRTAQKESTLRRFLPNVLKSLGPRDVLPLHLRPVSKFPAQLSALINRFEVVCGLENANHLNADVLA